MPITSPASPVVEAANTAKTQVSSMKEHSTAGSGSNEDVSYEHDPASYETRFPKHGLSAAGVFLVIAILAVFFWVGGIRYMKRVFCKDQSKQGRRYTRVATDQDVEH